MRRVYTKDKKDFLQKYFSEDENNGLRECVEWRDSIIIGKVDIRIPIPSVEKKAKEALKLVKD